MIDLTADIHSLTDFKRKTPEFVEQMRQTGHPLILTVNGKAELVVQDARSYQQMLDRLEQVEAIEGIRKGLESVRDGRTRPAKKALGEIWRKHDLSG